MKTWISATTGLLFLATAALALGGCGHWHRGHCSVGSGHGAYASADGHRHGPGCDHPYAP